MEPRRPQTKNAPPSHWPRTALWGGLVALVLAAALVYRLRQTPFDRDRFTATFENVSWLWLCLSILLMLLTYSGRALRWQVMLRPLKPHSSFWGIQAATVIGFTAVFLLGRPGELVRPYLIANRERVTFSSQMSAWVLERMFDLLFVLLIFGYALNRISPDIIPSAAGLRWVLKAGGLVATAIGLLSLILFFAFRNFSGLTQRRIEEAITFLPEASRAKVAHSLHTFAAGMEVTRQTANLLLLFAYSALEWVLVFGSLYALLHAFPVTSSFAPVDVMICLGFIAFGSIVQIPGVGGGIQVISVLVLTEVFGLSLESATGLAVLIWLQSFIAVVPIGLPLAVHQGLSWRKIKHLQEEATG